MTRNDGPKLTAAQKIAAIDRASDTLALRSGAGCGKTFVLARRFTQLLLTHADDRDVLSHFVALTFTDKAALEMRQRVSAMLREFAENATSEADRHQLFHWREQLPDAKISTIHSFCTALLRTRAVEAGLDPDFTVAGDQIVIHRLLRDAVQHAVLEAIESDDSDDVAALLSGMSYDALTQAVRKLLAERSRCDLPAWIDPDAILQQWHEQLLACREDAWKRLGDDDDIAAGLAALDALVCTNEADTLWPHFANARRLSQALLHDPDARSAETFGELAAIKPGSVGSKKHWNQPPKLVRHAIKTLQESLAPYAMFAEALSPIDTQAAMSVATLAKLAQRAQARYDAAKQERGLLDFDDLILHARDLLAQREDLRRAFAENISQLLIDEAQDTDATQLNLLLPALRDDAGQLDPKKLFLVGDAKQSIYRFRGAQVEGFTELCRSLGDDRQVNLDISFRTHAKGTTFVNDLFSQLLVDYAPTVSHRTDAPQGASVEILLADAPPEEAIDSSSLAKQAQAQLTAQRIDEMVRHGERIVRDAKTGTYRPVQYGDIAILFSRMTPSLDYERQLQQRNIPYYVVSGMGLFQQQEVYDLLNALRAIDTPHDDIATIGLLRSPMVGLDDNALAHLAETHTPPYLPSLNPAQLSERLDPAQFAALVRIQRLLAQLAGEKDAMGIDELLERLLAETGYEATLLAQPAGRRKVGNVRLLVEEARSATGQMTLAEFIELMGEQVLSSLRDEQAGVAGENDNVVRLMTIHKAKGLEFPVVVVPDLNAGPQSDKNPILIDPDWGLTTKLLPYVEPSEEDAADAPLAYRLAKQRDREADRDETLRKYYVALTRHEDHLVLVGANWRTKKDEFKPAGSFLAQLDEIYDLRGLLEAGRSQFAYRDETQGEHQARLACLTPTPPAARAASPTTPSAIAASTSTQAAVAAVSAAAGRASSATPPLLQALPTEAARIPLAVTALNQFAQCPARYHWQHELRSPYPPDPTPREKPVAKSTSAVPAALLGTFLHVCLEKLDLASPSIDDDWLDGIAASLPLPASISLPALRQASMPMLTRFLQSDWPARLASANQVHRELDFLLNVGQAQLTGQIDLLYQIGETWHVVDYKSDQLNSDHETQSQKKAAYELQLLIYAHAIHARTGCVPADATLLLLRSGETLTMDINETTLRDAQQKIARTAAALVDARSRGQFARCEKPHCPLCRNPALRHVGLAKTGD